MDFTLETYKKLLNTLFDQGFSFLSIEEFISKSTGKVIILRHDVDSLPWNSLEFARIQSDKGIKGTYYFRIGPQSFDEKIIKEIYSLGHEVGYHYEDVSMAAGDRRQATGRRRTTHDARHSEEELVKIAIESFKKNLEKLRKIVPVKTICMHGSPMSRWDSRLLWKYYDYHDFGIVGEPYFDVDFDVVLYLTDTGRCWDGGSFNIRDKAEGERRRADGNEKKAREEEGEKGGEENRDLETKRLRDEETSQSLSVPQSLSPLVTPEPSDRRTIASSSLPPSAYSLQPEAFPTHRTPHNACRTPFPEFHSTFDIIKAAEEGRLPDKIMMTFHPQRWTDKPGPWVRELVWQNVKNVGKYFLIRMRD